MTENEIRNHVANTARKYLGCIQGDAQHKYIVDIYNANTDSAKGNYTCAWCDIFVSAIGILSGFQSLIGTEINCGTHVNRWKKMGIWEEDDAYIPKVGDIIVFNWKANADGDTKVGASHVGVVIDCDGEIIETIEGNKGDDHVVGFRRIGVNHKWIRGFACPDYASRATNEGDVDVKVRELSKGMRGDDVRAVMTILKDKGYYSGIITKNDKLFGNNTHNAVKKVQAEKGMAITGIVDQATWEAIING